MRLFSLLGIALLTVLPASVRAQQAVTLADLVGTWVGGPTDTTYAPLKGQERSDTLILRSDSTYQLGMTINGRKMQVDEMASDNHFARLTSTNISWAGGPGYDFKLEGNTLTLVSVRANPQTRKKHYMAFTRDHASPSKP